jgi:hypothetical protein
MQIFQKSVPLTSHTNELLPRIYYSLHDQEKLVTDMQSVPITTKFRSMYIDVVDHFKKVRTVNSLNILKGTWSGKIGHLWYGWKIAKNGTKCFFWWKIAGKSQIPAKVPLKWGSQRDWFLKYLHIWVIILED